LLLLLLLLLPAFIEGGVHKRGSSSLFKSASSLSFEPASFDVAW
jgi:hypothetical protein